MIETNEYKEISSEDLDSFQKYQDHFDMMMKMADLQKRNAQLERQVLIQDLYLKYKLDPKTQSIDFSTGEIKTKEQK
jgi:hypothetical protein